MQSFCALRHFKENTDLVVTRGPPKAQKTIQGAVKKYNLGLKRLLLISPYGDTFGKKWRSKVNTEHVLPFFLTYTDPIVNEIDTCKGILKNL